ncbi:MAG: tyrosinase family protein [Alphaproteobacteria bacterium]|nr:tyrosinase family protein [Alphaproteobacteria bacterium]
MAFTRKNVWELGGDWADPILWYARGVKAMKARPLNDPTSWRFYAAIHGLDQGLWQQLGYLNQQDRPPSQADIATYWNQCQHGSWYFLPWHRGYLLALEAVVRDAIVTLNGPADWALPYWNYFKPNQDRLPIAFGSPDWPDGTGDNPLFVVQRYGPNNDGNITIPVDAIDLTALADPDFTGSDQGGSPGFGGVNSGFSHSGTVHGGIETQPHDAVHSLVGGGDPQSGLPGLMSDPDTAGLDPIFWLHHANIDRLWQVWRQNPATDVDPSDANWVNGPEAVGERVFRLPMPGGIGWSYTPGQMSDLTKLGYNYDDLSAPTAAPQMTARLQRFGLTSDAADALARSTAMQRPRSVELVGATQESLRLSGTETTAAVTLDPAVRRKAVASFAVTGASTTAPDRVFLNLENVRGLNDATAFKVYVNLPDGAEPAQHPDNLAGTIALFGVRKASVADDQHAGDGLTFVLEITHVVDKLHLSGAFNADQLHVRLVPLHPVPEAAQISIGRISVFRQNP